MKKLVLASAAILAAVSANAAQVNPYVSEKVSYSFASVSNADVIVLAYHNKEANEKDNVFGNRLAVGLTTAPISVISGALRAELEWGWNAKISTNNYFIDALDNFAANDIKTNTFAVNGYYDFDTGTAFKPYVGAGFGLAHISYVSESFGTWQKLYGKDSTNTIVWNVGAGVSYDICANIAVDLGYRYTNFGTVNGLATIQGFDNFQKLLMDLSSHEVNIGVRYAF
ncbi:MAG: outer membrane beta-barrel protein [Rickettsiales bacterium]|jgi:opacity protein-like surface antigen|nr:outer membrane beta-barrel protein [Rickettsiales bacterium]